MITAINVATPCVWLEPIYPPVMDETFLTVELDASPGDTPGARRPHMHTYTFEDPDMLASTVCLRAVGPTCAAC